MMKKFEGSKKCDVLIVGAGLAGLIAGLQLQRSGKQVLLVDKRSQIGGLCGTFTIRDYEFVIACNDFGSGLVDLLNKLNVKIDFKFKKSLIYYQGKFYNASPNFRTVWELRRYWRAVLALILAIVYQQLPQKKPVSIETFVDQCTPKGPVNDLAKIVPYFMGVPPYDMETSFFALEKQYGYGYTEMACPVGGPQKLADAIADKFIGQGGVINLNTTYLGYQKQQNFVIDVAINGQCKQILADYLVDTMEHTEAYPAGTKRGLPLSMMYVVVDNNYPYPENVHTLTYYHPDISQWFRDLDQGNAPDEFGFHLFRSDLEQKGDYYTLNIYFYLPRGQRSLTEEEAEHYKKYLLTRMEQMLPNITQAVRYTEIITPDQFEKMHGLSSRVMPFILHDNKPANASRELGLYHAGHTVNPPGEHAGAAALSGYLVAQMILNSSVHHTRSH